MKKSLKDHHKVEKEASKLTDTKTRSIVMNVYRDRADQSHVITAISISIDRSVELPCSRGLYSTEPRPQRRPIVDPRR